MLEIISISQKSEFRQLNDLFYGSRQSVFVFTTCSGIMGLSATTALHEFCCLTDHLAGVQVVLRHSLSITLSMGLS